MKERIDFIRNNWKLISWLLFIGIQLVIIPFGFALFVVGGINLHITTHALVMFTYKVWQKYLSYKYLRKIFIEWRAPYIESAIEIFPEKERSLRRIHRRHVTFDTFRYRIKKLGISEEDWVRIVNKSFSGKVLTNVILVPIYDIEHEILRMQVDSMVAQSYRGIQKIYLGINDGDDQATVDFLESYTKTLDTAIQFVVLTEPDPGKRNVQNTMILESFKDNVDIVCHMDGDGFADPDAVANIMMPFTMDKKIGLVTGDVRVLNMGYNMQTTVIGIRYHNAFYDDRGAFMNCPSGPNFAIRTDVLKIIRPIWYHDSFMNERMTFGDDRCMGYDIQLLAMIAEDPVGSINRLISRADELGFEIEDLEELLKFFEQHSDAQETYRGVKILLAPDSIVYTDAPTERQDYKNQQTRWNKSALIYNYKLYRSGVWDTLPFFAKNSLVYLTFYPVVVLGAMIFIIAASLYYLLIAGDVGMAVRLSSFYIISVIFIHWLFFSITGFLLTRDKRFVFSPLHFPLWLEVQMPAKYKAFRTLDNRDWGTRKFREK